MARIGKLHDIGSFKSQGDSELNGTPAVASDRCKHGIQAKDEIGDDVEHLLGV